MLVHPLWFSLAYVSTSIFFSKSLQRMVLLANTVFQPFWNVKLKSSKIWFSFWERNRLRSILLITSISRTAKQWKNSWTYGLPLMTEHLMLPSISMGFVISWTKSVVRINKVVSRQIKSSLLKKMQEAVFLEAIFINRYRFI